MNKNALGRLFCLIFPPTSSFPIADSNYDSAVAEDTWAVKVPMSHARPAAGVAVVEGKICAIG